MSKNCLIYETLNGVKQMNIHKTDEGLMTLSGVFGVCGVRNNNHRVYETSNYSKMVTEMKERIKSEGGIPGELEHPQQMNITLENVSHKITDINIDENGVVTGSITLLNTPKGKIAQAIVEGGLPLFISSRATGQVDKNSGNVTLEKIATYDLVGSPGFSQAKLHLNENQIAESINESSIYYITEKNDDYNDEKNNNIENMDLDNILERLEGLEERCNALESENSMLRERLAMTSESNQNIDINKLADAVQRWIVEEYSPVLQQWIMEECLPENNESVIEEATAAAAEVENIEENITDNIKDWFINKVAPGIQNWIVEEYSPEIQNWTINEFAPGIQKWIVEEYSPEVENWLNESYAEKVNSQISEAVETTRKRKLSDIDETLKILEGIQIEKPVYNRKTTLIRENLNEPKYIQDMPADKRIKYDMASAEVKESIQRRARIYDFSQSNAVEKFWESIDFDAIKPAKSIYEGLDNIIDEKERFIRAQLRGWKSRRNN